jgi:tetratricopeptide (TPR) repeat protein
MKHAMSTVAAFLAVAALGCGLAWSQQAAMPKVKSQKEQQALTAIQTAADADARIKAIDDMLTNFADTEFKVILLQMAVQTAQQKGDYTATTVWAERTLEADPKNLVAMLAIAQGIATHTREFDLDKEEKLGKAEKYLHTLLDSLKDAPKFRPDITDEQWTQAKKGFTEQAYEALGMVAAVRKKYDDAVADYKLALEADSSPDPAVLVRMGDAYFHAGKYDDAIAQFDKAIATPDAVAQIKQFAQARKAEAVKKKETGAKPAPTTTVPQVEIVKP